jgi:hypothetical protein
LASGDARQGKRPNHVQAMEVATMKLNTTQRPSLPTSAGTPSVSPVRSAHVAFPAVERAAVSRAYQVLTQAELGWTVGTASATNGSSTTGFVGSNGVAIKRMTDDASGVPPRGRPV